jgi:DMSO/TMAO reductase YedYZ molybdopterin-dependent catalytic subunit
MKFTYRLSIKNRKALFTAIIVLRCHDHWIKKFGIIEMLVKTITYILGFLVLAGSVLTVYSNSGADTGVAALKAVEIRQYQGQKLSSINDFRENSIAGPQKVSLENYRLKITGLVEHPLTLTYDQVLLHDHYSKVVTLHCVEGWDVTLLWEGVLIDDLLMKANVKPEAVVVIFHAADGYTSSLPLEFVRKNKLLLAYKMNGVNLPPERGFPFQVVAESKWGYKWVKWVIGIELSANADYKGYWESRDFNNNGDQKGPMLDR